VPTSAPLAAVAPTASQAALDATGVLLAPPDTTSPMNTRKPGSIISHLRPIATAASALSPVAIASSSPASSRRRRNTPVVAPLSSFSSTMKPRNRRPDSANARVEGSFQSQRQRGGEFEGEDEIEAGGDWGRVRQPAPMTLSPWRV
jgi:hypothetical protein